MGPNQALMKMAEAFMQGGPQDLQLAALKSFDAKLRSEIDSGSHSLRRRAQLMALRKKTGGVHEALRKARR